MWLVNGDRLALPDDVLGDITVAYGLGQAGEMTVALTDTKGQMTRSQLGLTGTSIVTGDGRWEVGGVKQTNLGQTAIAWDVRARSELARRLRKAKAEKAKGVRSTVWVANRAKAAGGKCWTQPSQRKATVDPGSDDTVMDIIDALASDLGWSWTEWDGNVLFMDPWWAWTEQPAYLPMWGVTWADRADTDALELETDLDDDDTATFGTGALSLPYAYGRRLRPMHTVDLRGDNLKGKRAGTWLITGVGWTANRPEAPVSVSIARPRKGIPQKRSGAGSTDLPSIGDLGSGEWIEGKDRRWLNCTRTPEEYVRWAVARNNTGYAEARCLRWVSEAVSGGAGRGGLYARYVWEKRPPGTPTTSSRTPPIGAIVVWDQESKGGHGGVAGHIGISLGGGKFISATSGRVQILTISGGWLGGYFGAMAPNFYT
jgi:hypothetical protein